MEALNEQGSISMCLEQKAYGDSAPGEVVSHPWSQQSLKNIMSSCQRAPAPALLCQGLGGGSGWTVQWSETEALAFGEEGGEWGTLTYFTQPLPAHKDF